MPKNYLKHIEILSNEVGELLKFKDLLIDALNSSSEGIALLDKEGKYIWLNKSHTEMFGYSHQELVGKSWKILYKKKDLAFFYENAFPQLEKEGHWNGKAQGIHKDNTTIINENVYLTSLKDGGLICTCIKI
jgi:PAS domain S-box-containing protein